MTLLALRNPTLQRQCYLVLPGLSLRMPSLCIKLARRPTNAWQKSWREQAAQRPSRPQNQPNEERMRSTHPRKRQRLVVMHGTTATIRPRPSCLAKLCSNHEIFITKINKFANLECFTKFLCLENLELYGMPFAFNTREQKLYYTETGPTVFEVNNRVHLCACMFIQYHGDLAGTCLYLMQVWKAFFIHTSTLH